MNAPALSFRAHLGLAFGEGANRQACWQLVSNETGTAYALADFEGAECVRIGFAPQVSEAEALAFFEETAAKESARNLSAIRKGCADIAARMRANQTTPLVVVPLYA
jgi:hypothetical protein